ncbi:MAG TPA: phosphoribosyltransferase family protein [Candidatus Angelobacter sp.]|jgi:putative phosphoribosyl transferase|nr:phosphoribosyltransferase family protein [Candidatus Angelobacter sp.]
MTTTTTFLSDTYPLPFPGRAEAGRILADRLKAFANLSDAVVVAIPNDGVPVAAQVATALNLPLTLQLVRKLGVPGQKEMFMGSIASDDVRIMNDETINALHIPERVVDWVVFCETQELLRRKRVFARDRKIPEVKGKTVVLVDEGVATGCRMLAAVQAIRKQGARRIVVAVPVGSTQGLTRLRAVADQVVCVLEPKLFFSVSHWYDNVEPVPDWEVCQILDGVTENAPALQMA